MITQTTKIMVVLLFTAALVSAGGCTSCLKRKNNSKKNADKNQTKETNVLKQSTEPKKSMLKNLKNSLMKKLFGKKVSRTSDREQYEEIYPTDLDDSPQKHSSTGAYYPINVPEDRKFKNLDVIIVKGASVKDLNGRYMVFDYHFGYYRYKKKELRPGQNFCNQKSRWIYHDDLNSKWNMGNYSNVYYENEVSIKHGPYPPEYEWKKSTTESSRNYDVSGVPTLQFGEGQQYNPDVIIVEDADEENVNGRYVKCLNDHDKPRYKNDMKKEIYYDKHASVWNLGNYKDSNVDYETQDSAATFPPTDGWQKPTIGFDRPDGSLTFRYEEK